MGFEDILYTEIRRAKDKKTQEKERKIIALDMVDSTLNAYLTRIELVTKVRTPREMRKKIIVAEKLYDNLETILIKIGSLLNPKLEDELKQYASLVQSLMDQPYGMDSSKEVDSMTDSLIKEAKIIIEKIQSYS